MRVSLVSGQILYAVRVNGRKKTLKQFNIFSIHCIGVLEVHNWMHDKAEESGD